MAKVTFNGASKLIVIDSGITDIDVKVDLYSDWKEWVLVGDNSKFAPAFRTTGGDPLGGAVSLGAYFFLQNDVGWRIRPHEANHTLTISGELYGEDPGLPLTVPTLGGYTVQIVMRGSSLTQAVSSDPSGIRDAVWSAPKALTVAKFIALK